MRVCLYVRVHVCVCACDAFSSVFVCVRQYLVVFDEWVPALTDVYARQGVRVDVVIAQPALPSLVDIHTVMFAACR